jgi:hypothetical protein
MQAKEPKDALEKRLMKKENWKLATKVDCYWQQDVCYCDFCKKQITGRHLIDGVLSDSYDFALMCPKCHKDRGDGFGEGKGQLYTRTRSGKWLLSFGFISDQIMEFQEEEFEEEESED